MTRVVDHLIAADDSEMRVMSMLRGQDLRDALVDEAELPTTDPDRLAGPFAHIVVDEAQELTDAEWQMLLLRCPSRSFTVVGDRAQARHGFTESWPERLERVGLDRIGCGVAEHQLPDAEGGHGVLLVVVVVVVVVVGVPASVVGRSWGLRPGGAATCEMCARWPAIRRAHSRALSKSRWSPARGPRAMRLARKPLADGGCSRPPNATTGAAPMSCAYRCTLLGAGVCSFAASGPQGPLWNSQVETAHPPAARSAMSRSTLTASRRHRFS